MPIKIRDRRDRKDCVRRHQTGASILEVLIASVFVASVIVSMALFFSQSAHSLAAYQARNFATQTGNTAFQQIKTKPYTLVALTLQGASALNGGYFLGPNCDCNNVNFSNFPNQQIVSNGKITFTQSVCVNLVGHTTTGWQSYCPGSADLGLRNVVINLQWMVGSSTQTLSVGGLVSQNARRGITLQQVGYVTVNLCQQDVKQPLGNCLVVAGDSTGGYQNPAMSSDQSIPPTPTEAAIYNGGLLIDNQGVVLNGMATGTRITLPVPGGSGYNLHVQKVNFYPFHIDSSAGGVNVVNGATTTVNVFLRKVDEYGSTMTGEVFSVQNPVISKVISGVGNHVGGCTLPSGNGDMGCDNATEAIELYNPTRSTYTIGSGGNLTVAYCTIGACWPSNTSGTDFFSGGMNPYFTFPSGNTAFLYPGSYLLIVGKDTRPNVANTVASQWGATTDISYDVWNSTFSGGSGAGLIP